MLLIGKLSLWEIAHRWCAADFDRIDLSLPSYLLIELYSDIVIKSSVRDVLRTLLEAIDSGKLIATYKRMDDETPLPYPQDIMNEIMLDDCAKKGAYESLLNIDVIAHSYIEREDFRAWCLSSNIALPLFWFPIYEENSMPMEQINVQNHNPKPKPKPRQSTECAIACRKIAATLWKEYPFIRIKEMAEHDMIQNGCKAAHYQLDTVKGWLRSIAPEEAKRKGRPCKKLK